MSEIANRVKEIIVEKLGVDEAEVVETAEFSKDLGADSLDTVELIMEFEKAFDITIPDTAAEKIKNVGEAIAFIEAAKA
ncbi:MAG: acyl carrier protein [Muribaculaceae bacterium]|nr:acyl carrier protein [Muribaculaceae bacterium]